MVKTVAILLLVVGLLSGCSQLNPLGFLSSGGTNVAANTQIGKTNTQTVGTTKNTEQKIVVETLTGEIEQSNDDNKVSTESVDNLTINEIPPWVILLLVLGWMLPTPQEMGRGLLKIITLGRYRGKPN
jgi:ABC-type glycerol-3-phosphate transport system substrate-binding protein